MVSEDKASGVLLGLACGDAFGRPVEFKSSERITAEYGTLTEMVGHGTWGKSAGTITDDTDQALCIARSLVECDGFDPTDVAERFVEWYDAGPFDVGNMTAKSIQRLKRGDSWDVAGQQVWEASSEGSNAGNGSVMRCPPLAVAFHSNQSKIARFSRASSQITHADPRCTVGCAFLNLTIAGYLEETDDPLSSALDRLSGEIPEELYEALEPIAAGDSPEQFSTSGYVVHTLQTALHDALDAENAEGAIVTSVNRGGDTDTIGAVAGAVAGARFGASDLPNRWVAEIDEEPELRKLATELLEIRSQ